MLEVKFVTKLLGSLSSFARSCLRRCAILIRSADKEGWSVAQLAESREDVRTEHTTNDISKMRNVIDIWQSASDQDVVLALLGQDSFRVGHAVWCN